MGLSQEGAFPTEGGITDLGEGEAGTQRQTLESGTSGCVLPFLPGALRDPRGIGIAQDPSSAGAGQRGAPCDPPGHIPGNPSGSIPAGRGEQGVGEREGRDVGGKCGG